jgi:hypothetical protein
MGNARTKGPSIVYLRDNSRLNDSTPSFDKDKYRDVYPWEAKEKTSAKDIRMVKGWHASKFAIIGEASDKTNKNYFEFADDAENTGAPGATVTQRPSRKKVAEIEHYQPFYRDKRPITRKHKDALAHDYSIEIREVIDPHRKYRETHSPHGPNRSTMIAGFTRNSGSFFGRAHDVRQVEFCSADAEGANKATYNMTYRDSVANYERKGPLGRDVPFPDGYGVAAAARTVVAGAAVSHQGGWVSDRYHDLIGNFGDFLYVNTMETSQRFKNREGIYRNILGMRHDGQIIKPGGSGDKHGRHYYTDNTAYEPDGSLVWGEFLHDTALAGTNTAWATGGLKTPNETGQWRPAIRISRGIDTPEDVYETPRGYRPSGTWSAGVPQDYKGSLVAGTTFPDATNTTQTYKLKPRRNELGSSADDQQYCIRVHYVPGATGTAALNLGVIANVCGEDLSTAPHEITGTTTVTTAEEITCKTFYVGSESLAYPTGGDTTLEVIVSRDGDNGNDSMAGDMHVINVTGEWITRTDAADIDNPTANYSLGGIAAAAISSSTIHVTWTNPLNNADIVRLDMATSASGPWSTITNNTPVPDELIIVSGLSASTTYYFRARGQDLTKTKWSDWDTENATTTS